MQRGRFAQEFLAELMREPRALRLACLAERARWLRGLRVTAREELLFELEMLLRAVELSFDRRHQSHDGRALLGQDFSEELRAVRDALHRATMVSRRLTATRVEQGLQFRAYVERQAGDEQKRTRLAEELVEQRSPDESLFVLRQALRAMHGLADQLLKAPYVTFQAFSDFATVGEQILLSSKYFRPPAALEFRAEYDRVGSVKLLELVKRVGEARARKALALGFLACFRLLRYLRYIPPQPTPAPRRALLVAQLVRDEAASVANYLATDVPRLTASASEAALIAAAAGEAAERLRDAIARVHAPLATRPLPREVLEQARDALSEGAKAAASGLAQAVEPGENASEIFDGQRARRERAERLRRDLWVLGQLLRQCLEDLFPAMRGEQARAFDGVAALVRFVVEFRQVGYYLLRSGDHEQFDRAFASLEALTHAAPSPARDRHLYLECRRFLTVVDRALALVGRRAELVNVAPDLAQLQAELQRHLAGGTPLTSRAAAEALSEADRLDEALAGHLAVPESDEWTLEPPAALDAALDGGEQPAPAPPTDEAAEPWTAAPGELLSAEDEASISEAEMALASEPGAQTDPDFSEGGDAEVTPAPVAPPVAPSEEEPFDPDSTRRIWRSE